MLLKWLLKIKSIMPLERPFWSPEAKGNFDLTGTLCIDLTTGGVNRRDRD